MKNRYFWVPGRINLIGEHTDYNDGLVLPAAVNLGILALARFRDDGALHLRSLDAVGDDWTRYAFAVLDILGNRRGMDLIVKSDIPVGSGMSSSAAICLAVALAATADAPRSPGELARVAQEAEHRVGVAVGIMDPWAIAHGKRGHALRIDCRTLETTPVPLALGAYALLVSDTGKRRELANSAYNTRREECAEAARRLGKVSLRDVQRDALGALPEPLFERARHVAEENARVELAVTALRAGDLPALGRLLDLSHASLRDLFQVSCRELDAMVDAVKESGGDAVLGARMMGGGFGGCTLSLVRRDALAAVIAKAETTYTAVTGLRPRFWAVEAGDGMREITA